MRPLLAVALLVGTWSGVLGAQAQPPAQLGWSADDSARIAFAEAHARAFPRTNAIVWAPVDSLDPTWLAGFVDSLDQALAHLKDLIGGPYPWQRIAHRPVRFHLSPGRFVSHASGRDAVFISLRAVRQRYAPYLHEAAHELLAASFPFYPYEYPDSVAEEAAAAVFPQWLSEGLPDVLAQTAAGATGFPEGDVFEIGGLARADSACAARLSGSRRRAEILENVGGNGRLQRVGVRALVTAFAHFPSGGWAGELEAAAAESMAALRRGWQEAMRNRPGIR